MEPNKAPILKADEQKQLIVLFQKYFINVYELLFHID